MRKAAVRNYHGFLGYRLISILCVVGFVQVLELLLLQRKYDIFTGGFLQPYSYLTWIDRLSFMGLSLWTDLVLFGSIGAAWFWFAGRTQSRQLVATYNFVFLSCSLTAIWLTVKFKALAYFNDTVNFLVIQNLGGGSFPAALSFVANETSIIIISLLILVIFYWIGLLFIRKQSNHNTLPETPASRKSRIGGIAALAVLTIALVWVINADPRLRYGLQKKTSYTLISSTLDRLTDWDCDGTGLFSFPVDSALLNPSIHPGALDKPGNGLDEDGYGGDFNWKGHTTDPLAQYPPTSGDHIVLIVLESVRGDLLDRSLSGKPVAPSITWLANNGSSIDFAYSHTGYTTSSLKAIFNRELSAGAHFISLVDYLEQSGYRISTISGQDESFGDIALKTGMQGPGRYLFHARSALEDRVYPSKESASLRLSEERVVTQFHQWAAETDWSKPQFLYINLQAAHFPYTHPSMPSLIIDDPIPRREINRDNRDWLEATYWNAVRVADQAVGEIIEHLKSLHVYDKTLLVVMSDHGESLFDDSFLGHGHALNKEQTHIPLIFNRPGIEVQRAVGQTEVAEMLIMAATGRLDNEALNRLGGPVFQFVGSLNKPRLIGMVSRNDVRTILDFRTRKVFFSELKHWEDFESAWTHPDLGPRIKMLIEMWEKTRWEDYRLRKISK